MITDLGQRHGRTYLLILRGTTEFTRFGDQMSDETYPQVCKRRFEIIYIYILMGEMSFKHENMSSRRGSMYIASGKPPEVGCICKILPWLSGLAHSSTAIPLCEPWEREAWVGLGLCPARALPLPPSI